MAVGKIMEKTQFLSFKCVNLNNGFWHDRYILNKNVSLENVRKRFEESGRFDAMRFNYHKTGNRPHIYFDSDVAKWIEAVAYLYVKDPESMSEYIKVCEELIDSMEKSQRSDGYLNSTHQQIDPQNIFKIRNNHELYCVGHLIEAAIAYAEATGRDRFLNVMERCCDCIYKAFISEKTAAFVTPGHEEIELALIKLYRYTSKPRYLEMAEFFLKNRGLHDEMYCIAGNRTVTQDDTDIYHLRDAKGHAVRALYLYCGIADLVKATGDGELLDNLQDVFEDITARKMYITGGVGSTYRTESFTVPYDLPNDTAYSESCAAIAMIMFATRMRCLCRDSKYGDTVERVLYNSLLSSTSLDGKSFFYTNPLEIAMEAHGREEAVVAGGREWLPIPQRVELFDCSCCPPNINRFFGNMEGYIALEENEHLTIEQYISSDISSSWGKVLVKESYATEGRVRISSKAYSSELLSIRIPAWSSRFEIKENGQPAEFDVKNGYAEIKVGKDFTIDIDFHIKPRAICANSKVTANLGRAALTYGPIVYCLEKADNGERLNRIEVDFGRLSEAKTNSDFHGFKSISLPAYIEKDDDRLYFDLSEAGKEKLAVKFIPYYAFANRGEGDMLVWVRVH